MKKLSFNEVASKNTMTPSQMKQIKGGGGSCAFYWPDMNLVGCPTSKENALEMVQGVPGAKWCCDSCEEASWYNKVISNC